MKTTNKTKLDCDYKKFAGQTDYLLAPFFYEYARALPEVQKAIIDWRKILKEGDINSLMEYGNISEKMLNKKAKISSDYIKVYRAASILKKTPEALKDTPVELRIFLLCFSSYPNRAWDFKKNCRIAMYWEKWWKQKCKITDQTHSAPLCITNVQHVENIETLKKALNIMGLEDLYLIGIDWSSSDMELGNFFRNWLKIKGNRPVLKEEAHKSPLGFVLNDLYFPAKPITLLLALGVWKMKSDGKKYREIMTVYGSPQQGAQASNQRKLISYNRMAADALGMLFPKIKL